MDNVMQVQVLCQCCYPIFPTNMLTEGQVLMMGGLQCPLYCTVTQCPVINHIFAGPGLNVSSVEECAPIAASKHHCQATIATMEGAHCCYHSQDAR